MDDKLTIFIAITSAAVVLQMLILAGMFFVMRRMATRMQSLTEDVQSRVLPLVEDAKKLTSEAQSLLQTTRPKLEAILENVSVVSTTARDQTQKLDAALTAFMDRARLHAIRADELFTRTFDRVEDTSSKVQHTVLSPFKHLNGVLQGIGVGLDTLIRKSKRPRNGKPTDEMFI